MTPIQPTRNAFLLPLGTRSQVYAEDQPQYIDLPCLKTPDGRVVTQWTLDANERLLLERGVPITLVLHTFNGPLQPILLAVGGVDLR